MFGWNHMSDAAGWLVMSSLMLVVLVALVMAALAGWRLFQPSERSGPTDTARRILDERYAKGEIDEEEYQQRQEFLSHR